MLNFLRTIQFSAITFQHNPTQEKWKSSFDVAAVVYFVHSFFANLAQFCFFFVESYVRGNIAFIGFKVKDAWRRYNVTVSWIIGGK